MSWTNKKDQGLRKRAAHVIPGGMYGHESTKMLPDAFPQFFQSAKGATLVDTDGQELIDYMCAYGPNLFGYGHEEINEAAIEQLRKGDTLTGPSSVMIELAEKFTRMVSHADWAMFCKNGTDTTSMALTISRAHTGHQKVLLATGAYHGAASWCTPIPTGTVPEDRAHHIYYTYNNADSLREARQQAGDDLAAIFATPFKHDAFADQEFPDEEYAKACREICDDTGALLIVDDVRAGFRLARDCSWTTIGVDPDLSTWGKCIANGHPISALLGSDVAKKAATKIYSTGSFWFSAAPMAAALKTLELVETTDYLEQIERIGSKLRTGLAQQAAEFGFTLKQTGPSQMPQILFEDDADFRKGYFWVEASLKEGVYMHPWHNMFISAAHTDDHVDRTLEVTRNSFEKLAAAAPTLGPVEQLAGLFPRG